MDKTPSEITKLVDDAEKNVFNELYTRMDEDYDGIWNMSHGAYTSYGREIESKTKKHGSELEVASNDLRHHCDRVVNKLISSERQIRVLIPEQEGEDLRDDMGALERLLDFAFENGDERLLSLILPKLKEMVSWYGAVRGWQAGRFLVYKKGKGASAKVIFDFMGLDPRWLTYEVGENNLPWINYKTFKSEAVLKKWYEVWKKPWDKSSTSTPVYDYWEDEENGKISNAVICNNKFVHQETLEIPSMPFVILPVAIRPPIAGTDGIKLKGYGESVFATGRYINEVRNRFASIVLHHANLKANQPMILYTAMGGSVLPEDAFFDVPGGFITLTKDAQKLEASPFPDVSQTEIAALRWLSEQLEQTILPPSHTESPPASGTRAYLSQEEGAMLYAPQLRTLENFYASACRKIEEQLIAGGITVKVTGEDKKERKYFEVKVTPVNLKVPHIIKVELTADAPWRRYDTYQVAQMARQLGVPEEYVNEFILKFPDPKGVSDRAAMELFEKSPKGAMLTAMIAFKKRGGEFDKDIIASLARDIARMEMQENMMAGGGKAEVSPEREAVRPPLEPAPPLERMV